MWNLPVLEKDVVLVLRDSLGIAVSRAIKVPFGDQTDTVYAARPHEESSKANTVSTCEGSKTSISTGTPGGMGGRSCRATSCATRTSAPVEIEVLEPSHVDT